MTPRAGEKADRTGVYSCATCGCTVSVQRGHTMPRCPNGHTDFEPYHRTWATV
jgi:hypothetical protein